MSCSILSTSLPSHRWLCSLIVIPYPFLISCAISTTILLIPCTHAALYLFFLPFLTAFIWSLNILLPHISICFFLSPHSFIHWFDLQGGKRQQDEEPHPDEELMFGKDALNKEGAFKYVIHCLLPPLSCLPLPHSYPCSSHLVSSLLTPPTSFLPFCFPFFLPFFLNLQVSAIPFRGHHGPWSDHQQG